MAKNIIIYIKRFFILSVFLAVLTACSDKENFRIEGKMLDGSSHIIELTYYEGSGFKRLTTQSGEDGKFVLEGTSKQPALGLFSISGSHPVATVIIENGDNLNVELPPVASLDLPKIKGNKASESLAKFDEETAALRKEGKDPEINRRVADYIKSHPKDIVSTVLLVMRFESAGNETFADSLLGMISTKARPVAVMQNFTATLATQLSSEARADVQGMTLYDRRDTTIRYAPQRQSYTLLAFVDTERRMRDSIIPRLREMRENYPVKRLTAIEVSLARDSASWKRSVAKDSATWIQAWAPGTVASSNFRKLAVGRAPFFIVSDSTGHQLYRGSSVKRAQDEIIRRLGTPQKSN